MFTSDAVITIKFELCLGMVFYKPDYFSAVARNAYVKGSVKVAFSEPNFGDLVLVRVLGGRGAFTYIEDHMGVKRVLRPGTVFVGALGRKESTIDIAGHVPEKLSPHCTLHLLTFGGLIGKSFSYSRIVGPPLDVEYLGTLVKDGRVQNLVDFKKVDWRDKIGTVPPLVIVIGTSAGSGKTTAAANIIRGAIKHGYRVSAVKPTGVGALRDLRALKSAGARPALDFVDAGLPSTYVDRKTLLKVAKGLIYEAALSKPDFIVVEFGGSICGYKSVAPILSDPEISGSLGSIILSAGDVTAAFGGVTIARLHYALDIDLVVGPATDTEIGRMIVGRLTGVRAFNLYTDKQVTKEFIEYLIRRRPRTARLSPLFQRLSKEVYVSEVKNTP